VIGDRCTVGLYHVIEEGAKIEDGSVVAEYALVPKETTIPAESSYFSSHLMTKSSNKNLEYSNAVQFVLLGYFFKTTIGWSLNAIQIVSGTGLGYLVHRYLDIDMYLKTVVIMTTVLFGSATSTILLLLSTGYLFSPNPNPNERQKIIEHSLGMPLYMLYLQMVNIVNMYLKPFLSGTFLWTLIHKLCGMKINRVDNVCIMGYICDSKVFFVYNSGLKSWINQMLILKVPEGMPLHRLFFLLVRKNPTWRGTNWNLENWFSKKQLYREMEIYMPGPISVELN
jgi:hypothetical protein